MTEQLRVPGATLHVERRGSGPTLLFVVGGSGDPELVRLAVVHEPPMLGLLDFWMEHELRVYPSFPLGAART